MRCYNCTKPHVYNNEEHKCNNFDYCKAEDDERRAYFKKINSDITVGSLIKFKGYKRYFTVVARDERFIIAIKNWREKYHYTICDLQECIRGADNRYNCIDYKHASRQEILSVLEKLHIDLDKDSLQNIQSNIYGNLDILSRNWIPLDIVEVIKPKTENMV